MWRKGLAPLTNDNTPASIGPEDYALWRLKFGSTNADNDIGGAGTLNWTAGEITGVTGFHTGGPSLRVGRHVNLSPTQLTEYDFPGIVTQNGATTKIMLIAPESRINIGEDGTTPTPLNSYTLVNGTIGTAIGGAGLDGANGNNGINVKNGTFTMLGGQVIDATPDDLRAGTLTKQRFLTVSSTSGPAAGTPGTENYASATFTGGTVDSLGGIRVATSSNSRGYLNINGPIVITTGGDTSIGYNATNGVGEMNMSAGMFNVGRTYTDPVSGTVNPLLGRFIVGDRGRGTLNMTGGTVNVTTEVRVGADHAAGGSLINQTGGTITTPAFLWEFQMTTPLRRDISAARSLLMAPRLLSRSQDRLELSSDIKARQRSKFAKELRLGRPRKYNPSWQQGHFRGHHQREGRQAHARRHSDQDGSFLGRSDRQGDGRHAGVEQYDVDNRPGFSFGPYERGRHTDHQAGCVVQVTLGRRAQIAPPLPIIAANFAMSSGTWNIDVGSNGIQGADQFNASAGTASLTGGTLNLNYLSGFTPIVGTVYRILRGGLGTTLGPVTITGAGAGSWVLQEAPITTDLVNWPNDEQIQLKFVGPGAGSGGGLGTAAVPEPTSVALVVLAVVALLNTRGSRSQTKRNRTDPSRSSELRESWMHARRPATRCGGAHSNVADHAEIPQTRQFD